jgi:serine/threonine protein kinase
MKVSNWKREEPKKQEKLKSMADREFKAMALCKEHQNIIGFEEKIDLDYGVAAIIEIGTEGSLKHFLEDHFEYLGADNPDNVLRLVLQMARGLQYIHKQGFIHRDVKLDNMVLKDGVVKIIDFGLCIENGETKGPIAGDPRYVDPMAVEVGKNKFQWTPASDVYSLGVVLHELTFFEVMYSSEEFLEVAPYSAARNNRPARLSAGTDETVAVLISKMTQWEPTHRISMQGVIDEIKNHLKSGQRHQIKETSITNLETLSRSEGNRLPVSQPAKPFQPEYDFPEQFIPEPTWLKVFPETPKKRQETEKKQFLDHPLIKMETRDSGKGSKKAEKPLPQGEKREWGCFGCFKIMGSERRLWLSHGSARLGTASTNKVII